MMSAAHDISPNVLKYMYVKNYLTSFTEYGVQN